MNGQPINLYVELLIVADQTIYQDHKRFLQTNDSNLIFENMKIYYSHFFNGVNQHYQNSLSSDPDLRLSIKLRNFLFFTNYTSWTDNTKYGVAGQLTYNGKEVLIATQSLSAFSSYMETNIALPFTYDMAVSLFKYLLFIRILNLYLAILILLKLK